MQNYRSSLPGSRNSCSSVMLRFARSKIARDVAFDTTVWKDMLGENKNSLSLCSVVHWSCVDVHGITLISLCIHTYIYTKAPANACPCTWARSRTKSGPGPRLLPWSRKYWGGTADSGWVWYICDIYIYVYIYIYIFMLTYIMLTIFRSWSMHKT